jgi:hypothetical protein
LSLPLSFSISVFLALSISFKAAYAALSLFIMLLVIEHSLGFLLDRLDGGCRFALADLVSMEAL